MCIELGDDAVPLLGTLKSLRTLNITQTSITPAGVERLKKCCPPARFSDSRPTGYFAFGRQ